MTLVDIFTKAMHTYIYHTYSTKKQNKKLFENKT